MSKRQRIINWIRHVFYKPQPEPIWESQWLTLTDEEIKLIRELMEEDPDYNPL